MTIDDVYREVLRALEVTGTRFAFIGALGAITWGRPRATTDLDLVVLCDAARFATLKNALATAHIEEGAGVGPAEPTDPLPDIAVFWAGERPAIRIDVFIAKLDFEREVVESAVPSELFGSRAPVARVEAMLVYKLLAGRPKDLLDVEGMLEGRALAGQVIDWGLCRRWASAWDIEARVEALRARPPPST